MKFLFSESPAVGVGVTYTTNAVESTGLTRPYFSCLWRLFPYYLVDMGTAPVSMIIGRTGGGLGSVKTPMELTLNPGSPIKLQYHGGQDERLFGNKLLKGLELFAKALGATPTGPLEDRLLPEPVENGVIHLKLDGTLRVGSPASLVVTGSSMATRFGFSFPVLPNPEPQYKSLKLLNVDSWAAVKTAQFNGLTYVYMRSLLLYMKAISATVSVSSDTFGGRSCNWDAYDWDYSEGGDRSVVYWKQRIRWWERGYSTVTDRWRETTHNMRVEFYHDLKLRSLSLGTIGSTYPVSGSYVTAHYHDAATCTRQIWGAHYRDGITEVTPISPDVHFTYPNANILITTAPYVPNLTKEARQHCADFVEEVHGFGPSYRRRHGFAYRGQEFKRLIYDVAPSAFYASAEAVSAHLDLQRTNWTESILELGDWLAALALAKDVWDLCNHARKHPEYLVRDIADVLTDAELFYAFGLRPGATTISDASHFAADLGRIRSRLAGLSEVKVLYGKFEYNFPNGTFDFDQAKLTTHSKLYISLPASAASTTWLGLSGLGLAPNLANTWDVIPLSFVVDWVFNVGGRLGDLDDTMKMMLCKTLLAVHSFGINLPISEQALNHWGMSFVPSEGDHMPRIRYYARFLSRLMPAPRESKFDFRGITWGPDIRVVSSLAYKAMR